MSKAPICGVYCKQCDLFLKNDKLFYWECWCATEDWYDALKRGKDIEIKEKWGEKGTNK